jgi:simple sugar transport system ATP-binding protein
VPAADVLRVEGVAKRFGALTALRDVNLRLGPGEVLGLIGDNGAGKSTLIKIICGFQAPDAGRIFINDTQVTLRSVDHARSLGIDTVYQDLALVNEAFGWTTAGDRRRPLGLLGRTHPAPR